MFVRLMFFRPADQDECAVTNGGCSHECVDLPLGFMCVCPSGMRLLGESQCEGEGVVGSNGLQTT